MTKIYDTARHIVKERNSSEKGVKDPGEGYLYADNPKDLPLEAMINVQSSCLI